MRKPILLEPADLLAPGQAFCNGTCTGNGGAVGKSNVHQSETRAAGGAFLAVWPMLRGHDAHLRPAKRRANYSQGAKVRARGCVLTLIGASSQREDGLPLLVMTFRAADHADIFPSTNTSGS